MVAGVSSQGVQILFRGSIPPIVFRKNRPDYSRLRFPLTVTRKVSWYLVHSRGSGVWFAAF